MRLLRVALAVLLGLRLHLVCTLGGLPVLFALTGAKADERETLHDMLDTAPFQAQRTRFAILFTPATTRGFHHRTLQESANWRASPCSGAKLKHAATAGELYIGSLHKHARKTADALTQHGGTVLVLSALHGLLPLDCVIKPYDHTWKDRGSITTRALCAQAVALGVAGAPNVILLTPGEYTKRAAVVWPHARTPLAHLAIGKQRSRLTALRENPTSYAAPA